MRHCLGGLVSEPKSCVHSRAFWLPAAGGEAAGAVLSPVVKSDEAGEEQGDEPLTAYPENGYWALSPGCRLRMLRALCCDALDTAIIR